MRISMPRGDLRLVRFLVNDRNGTATDVDFTEIYFTVKRSAKDRLYEFQKRLTKGGIIKLGLGDYQLRIEPKDTNKMLVNSTRFPNYVFDINVKYESNGHIYVNETKTGEFVLTDEVTYAENEGDDE